MTGFVTQANVASTLLQDSDVSALSEASLFGAALGHRRFNLQPGPTMTSNSDAEIRHIYERWHESVVSGDLDSLVALYAMDAVLETPLIVATLGKAEGVLKGKTAIRSFFEAGFRKLQKSSARWYRTGLFFANGRQLIWEYPRETPAGDQVDLVEVMDIADGLIVSHRVYWGWVGFKTLISAMQDRSR